VEIEARDARDQAAMREVLIVPAPPEAAPPTK
jgi:hypothetical protein